MREFPSGPPKPANPYAWLWEPLEDDPTFVLRTMFGSPAVYLHGKMMLCFCMRSEQWRGMLVCTAREDHASLMADIPELKPHEILNKWLYLPISHGHFETIAEKVVRMAQYRDPRIGVVPAPKKKRKAKI
jgi:hypothetical protein